MKSSNEVIFFFSSQKIENESKIRKREEIGRKGIV